MLHQLLSIVDAAYDRASWHGTNLRGSIRGLSVRQAAWRPSSKRHNIWELVLHAAYWKYTALRRLTDAPRGSFPLNGSNWFTRGDNPDERTWREDVALLDRTHRSLRAASARLSSSELARTPAGSKVSNFALLSGIAAHDLYHAGQIQLLKRLFLDAATARNRSPSYVGGRLQPDRRRGPPHSASRCGSEARSNASPGFCLRHAGPLPSRPDPYRSPPRENFGPCDAF